MMPQGTTDNKMALDTSPSETHQTLKRRRWPGIVPSVLLVLLIIVGAAVLLLTRKPIWHTYVTRTDTDTKIQFLIDYPDGWKPIKTPVNNSGGSQIQMPKGFLSVGFQRKPPTGFAGWWSKTVLREDPIAWKQARIGFTAYPYTGLAGATGQDELKMLGQATTQMYSRQPSTKVAYRIVQHPLGPALDLTIIVNGVQRNRGSPIPAVNRMLYIFLTEKRFKRYLMAVNTSCSEREEAHIETIFQEFAKRIRLIP